MDYKIRTTKEEKQFTYGLDLEPLSIDPNTQSSQMSKTYTTQYHEAPTEVTTKTYNFGSKTQASDIKHHDAVNYGIKNGQTEIITKTHDYGTKSQSSGLVRQNSHGGNYQTEEIITKVVQSGSRTLPSEKKVIKDNIKYEIKGHRNGDNTQTEVVTKVHDYGTKSNMKIQDNVDYRFREHDHGHGHFHGHGGQQQTEVITKTYQHGSKSQPPISKIQDNVDYKVLKTRGDDNSRTEVVTKRYEFGTKNQPSDIYVHENGGVGVHKTISNVEIVNRQRQEMAQSSESVDLIRHSRQLLVGSESDVQARYQASPNVNIITVYKQIEGHHHHTLPVRGTIDITKERHTYMTGPIFDAHGREVILVPRTPISTMATQTGASVMNLNMIGHSGGGYIRGGGSSGFTNHGYESETIVKETRTREERIPQRTEEIIVQKVVSHEHKHPPIVHENKMLSRNSGHQNWRETNVHETKNTTINVQEVNVNINVTVAPEPTDEEAYRQWLIATFKHQFDPYESQGGMPTNVFTEMIKGIDMKRTTKLDTLFVTMDKDKNNRVNWHEFYSGMTYKKASEVSKFKYYLNIFVESLTPAAKHNVDAEKKKAEESGEPIPEESYMQAYNCRPPPLFIPIIFLIIWIFFIIYTVELNNGPDWNYRTWNDGLAFYSPLVFCPSVREQVWRFFSYMFLHSGWHHIVFNTIVSLILGIPLEMVHKFWRVGPVYMIGVVFGSLSSSVADTASALVGASGGTYALIGANYATVLMNWEELQEDGKNCRKNPCGFLVGGIMRLVYLTLLVILDVGIAIYNRYYSANEIPISMSAHIGGIIAGFLVGIPILRNIDKKWWEKYVEIVASIIMVILFVICILFNIIYKGFPQFKDIECSNTTLMSILA